MALKFIALLRQRDVIVLEDGSYMPPIKHITYNTEGGGQFVRAYHIEFDDGSVWRDLASSTIFEVVNDVSNPSVDDRSL